MKILNLYAGIGGNRKLWEDQEVTAVEYDYDILNAYRKFFPNDSIICGDAHQYLLEHYQEFDFIWSSPPCQSHSSFRHNICVRFHGTEPVYPDMKLYQEILFLQHNDKKKNGDKIKWVVENVKPYYEPLIKPTAVIQRHYFWSNFDLSDITTEFQKDKIRSSQIPDLQKIHGFDLTGIKLKNKRQVLRNCVLPEIGLQIFNRVT